MCGEFLIFYNDSIIFVPIVTIPLTPQTQRAAIDMHIETDRRHGTSDFRSPMRNAIALAPNIAALPNTRLPVRPSPLSTEIRIASSIPPQNIGTNRKKKHNAKAICRFSDSPSDAATAVSSIVGSFSIYILRKLRERSRSVPLFVVILRSRRSSSWLYGSGATKFRQTDALPPPCPPHPPT